MRNHATALRQGTLEAGEVRKHVVQGEPFIVSVEDGVVTLSHPEWSLMGTGASVAEAEAALIVEAAALRVVMTTIPDESLNDAARDMKDFLDRIATT